MRPLFPAFDAAVLSLCALWVPQGYRVTDDATATTLDVLRALSPGAPLPIWAGGSDRTVFGAPSTNHAFRAWHDAGHLRLGADFTPEGERAVARLQVSQLREICNGAVAGLLCRLLWTEVVGQGEYLARWGEFPTDQRRFDVAYLCNPSRALSRRY